MHYIPDLLLIQAAKCKTTGATNHRLIGLVACYMNEGARIKRLTESGRMPDLLEESKAAFLSIQRKLERFSVCGQFIEEDE